jgi:hypothetical protein
LLTFFFGWVGLSPKLLRNPNGVKQLISLRLCSICNVFAKATYSCNNKFLIQIRFVLNVPFSLLLFNIRKQLRERISSANSFTLIQHQSYLAFYPLASFCILLQSDQPHPQPFQVHYSKSKYYNHEKLFNCN